MYNLTQKEIEALKMYNDINVSKLDNGSCMVKCQSLLENLVKEACLKISGKSVSNLSEGINKFLDDYPPFINAVNTKGFKEYREDYKRFRNNALFINGKSNDFKHGSNIIPDELETDLAKGYIKNSITWYFTTIVDQPYSNISSTDARAMQLLAEFMQNSRKQERIVERETYYVILLIDSSQSMVWPYLDDQSNANNDSSADYRNALIKVQNAMGLAHEKCLTALRASSICFEGYMKVYQYTFNHKKKLLNLPEELTRVNKDNVAKISSNNYNPEGKTALYDVILESLNVVYDDYLKKTMETDKRIDKLSIGVITDGEDTMLSADQKAAKINEIKRYLKMLRGDGDVRKCFLVSSVLIGLTGQEFSENNLKEIKKELSFDDSISINQADEQSIRKAFKLFSTNAINV